MISVVMSTRNDPIGCLFTIRGLLEEGKSISDIEIIVVDNSDNEDTFEFLDRLIDNKYKKEKVKLIRQEKPCIFTARDLGVEEAKYDTIIILDSHMILGKNSLISLNKLFVQAENVGIVYGPLVYHDKIESAAFHSRCLETFKPLKFGELKKEYIKIPFRGAPFAFQKNYYQKIGGYGVLSKYELSWGGGDAYIGIKSLLFGRDNYLLRDFIGIHIGPFKDDPFLYKTSEFEKVNGMRWTGVLVAGYALGGESLLNKRVDRIRKRLERMENFNDNMLAKICIMGEKDRRWIKKNAPYTYEEVLEKWQR